MFKDPYEKPIYTDKLSLNNTIWKVEMEINRCRFVLANYEAELRFADAEGILTNTPASKEYLNEVLDRINHYNGQIIRLQKFLEKPVLGKAPEVIDNDIVFFFPVE